MIPTISMTHSDQFLTEMSVAMFQDPGNYVAGLAFSQVGVVKDSDKYVIYNMDDFNRDEAQLRANGAESEGGGYRLSEDSYSMEKFSWHKMVTERDRRNTDDPMDADEDAVRYVTQVLKTKVELSWRDEFFAASKWDKDLTGVAAAPVAGTSFLQWNEATSVPIDDIDDAKLIVEAQTGLSPNTLVVSPHVWYALKRNDQILERIVGGATPGAPAIATLQNVAAVMELDQILVAKGVVNSANEGQTGDTDFIMGKHALLVHTDPSAGVRGPCAGKIFYLNAPGVGEFGNVINRIAMDQNEVGTERIEGDIYFDMKVVSSVLGVFFSGAVA